MRHVFWLPALILIAPACAKAQVRVDPAALRQLQGLPIVPPATQPVAVEPPVNKLLRHHDHPRRHISPVQPRRQQLPPPPPAPNSRQPTPQRPSVPQPPPAPHESATPAPPLPAPVVTPHRPVLPPTVRIEFAPDSAILPADAAATLKPFCTTKSRIPILARAPATPANPGIAMQLSMQRAFAIRAALIACGVAAQNIIPQSTGGVSANGNEALIGARAKP